MRFIINNAQILSGIIAGAIIILMTVLFDTPVAESFALGLMVYIGLWFLRSYGKSKYKPKLVEEMAGYNIQDKIDSGFIKLQNIKELNKKIKDKELRTKINDICNTAKKIFESFDQDEEDAKMASRFLLYLDRFLMAVERYVSISSTEEGREVITDSGDKKEFIELIDTADEAFKSGFKNYLENDVIELRTLSRVLKKMMDNAEIGK